MSEEYSLQLIDGGVHEVGKIIQSPDGEFEILREDGGVELYRTYAMALEGIDYLTMELNRKLAKRGVR